MCGMCFTEQANRCENIWPNIQPKPSCVTRQFVRFSHRRQLYHATLVCRISFRWWNFNIQSPLRFDGVSNLVLGTYERSDCFRDTSAFELVVMQVSRIRSEHAMSGCVRSWRAWWFTICTHVDVIVDWLWGLHDYVAVAVLRRRTQTTKNEHTVAKHRVHFSW